MFDKGYVLSPRATGNYLRDGIVIMKDNTPWPSNFASVEEANNWGYRAYQQRFYSGTNDQEYWRTLEVSD